MQIFILDKDILRNAKYYCDKHIVKIPTEICQILCTVARQSAKELPNFCYKSTHKNHPLVKWVAESLGNWNYAVELGKALLDEYYFRFERYNKHLRNRKILQHFSVTFPVHIPVKPKTKFYLAIPDKYKCENPVKSYRDYYRQEKKYFVKYTKRMYPKWLKTIN